MLKIKVYDCNHEKDLEESVNGFMDYLQKNNKEVIDIKYSVSNFGNGEEQIYSFSALIMYDDIRLAKYIPKRYELVEKIEE